MPLFFLIAGYFAKGETCLQNVQKNARRLLIPYFFTSGILILFNCVLYLYHGWTLYNIQDYLVAWLCDYGFPYRDIIISFGALWFLTALFCSNCIFNIALYYIHDEYLLSFVCLVIGISGVLIAKQICIPFNLDIGMYAIVFEYVGHLLKQTRSFEGKDVGIHKYFWILVASIFYFIGTYYYSYDLNTRLYTYPIISSIAAISGSYLFLLICKSVNKLVKVNAIFSWCGKNSLSFLCLHILEHIIVPWHKLGWVSEIYPLRIMCKIFLIYVGTVVISKMWGIRKIYGY